MCSANDALPKALSCTFHLEQEEYFYKKELHSRETSNIVTAGAADGLLPEVGFMVQCCLMGRKFAYFMQIWEQEKLIRLSLVNHYLHVGLPLPS